MTRVSPSIILTTVAYSRVRPRAGKDRRRRTKKGSRTVLGLPRIMVRFYQNGRGCQGGMRAGIPSGEEALKGLLNMLSMCFDFVEAVSFPAPSMLHSRREKMEFWFSILSPGSFLPNDRPS
jgi:hypothetical protein